VVLAFRKSASGFLRTRTRTVARMAKFTMRGSSPPSAAKRGLGLPSETRRAAKTGMR
jgi:hypothetical protein